MDLPTNLGGVLATPRVGITLPAVVFPVEGLKIGQIVGTTTRDRQAQDIVSDGKYSICLDMIN